METGKQYNTKHFKLKNYEGKKIRVKVLKVEKNAKKKKKKEKKKEKKNTE